jgi:hypothetical protein
VSSGSTSRSGTVTASTKDQSGVLVTGGEIA